MMGSQLPTIVRGIIQQRKKLMKLGVSGKNNMRCAVYIKEISNYVDAFGDKWDDNRWRAFVCKHMEKISYLIPENKSGETILSKLYENI